MIARWTTLTALFLVLAVVLPVHAGTGDDRRGHYLDPPDVASDAIGGGNGGDSGGPWPGGGLSYRIAPFSGNTRTASAAADVSARGIVLAWTAWDGHDTEIAVAFLGRTPRPRARLVTCNGGADDTPELVRGEGNVLVLTWLHRGRRGPVLEALPLAPDGSPAGRARSLGRAGRERLVGLLPGGRLAVLRVVGPVRRPRLELYVEGTGTVPLARLAADGTLVGVARDPRGGLLFRFRDGTLLGQVVVSPEGGIDGPDWRGE